MPCDIQKQNDRLKKEVAKLKATIRILQAKILELLKSAKNQ
jgi:hypothetical protein